MQEKEITGKSQFNCWIPTETFEEIKKKNWKFGFVVEEGVKFLNNRTNIRSDVEETRTTTDKLQKANQRMQERIFDLQTEMEKIKEKYEK